MYFQSPGKSQMAYPCIVFKIDDYKVEYADNSPYRLTKRYEVMYIDRKPTSKIPDKLAALPMSRFASFFVAENLNHTVFSIYF